MGKDLKMAPLEEQLRQEGVLHLKKSRDKRVLDVSERLSCRSWMWHTQCGSRNQETWVGGKEEGWRGRCSWKWRQWAPVPAIAKWEFCWVGPLGPLPSPTTPGNQTHQKIVGVLSLEMIYFTTKINRYQRFPNFKDGEGEGKHRHLQRVNWKNTGWTLYKYLPEWRGSRDTAAGTW